MRILELLFVGFLVFLVGMAILKLKMNPQPVPPPPVVENTVDNTDVIVADTGTQETVSRETVTAEESLAEAAMCSYPGDGFTPHVEGTDPMNPPLFEDADLIEGYEWDPLPILTVNGAPVVPSACVVMTYDISAEGQVVNIEIYDVQPSEPVIDEYYPKTATVAMRSQVWKPAMLDGEAVAFINNTVEIRFEPPVN